MVKKALVLALVMGTGSCGGGDEATCPVIDTTYQPVIDPANFVAVVDNPLYPLVPGTTYTYEAGDETIVVAVTNETKLVQGVTCIVVRDTVTVAGEVTEDTFDWYAQDRDGNVWYMGEDTKEYEDGVVVSTEGSWQAGVDGAKAGIIMKASPAVGDSYRQEYLPCEAEDEAEVIATDEPVTVPAGSYLHCLRTHDSTRLEPALNEDKYYCPGIGVALEINLNTGGRLELVSRIAP
ncbi:MAG: hypothetical protein HY907_09105 [Deltaproteobacteria bacterium]|nr:hypothetical protein [Deltaproteobacteria bacterium]